MRSSLASFTLRVLGLAVATLLLSACESNIVGPMEEEDPPTSVSFASDIQPLLTSRCASCHIGQATSGVNLSTYETLIASSGALYGEAIVKAGDAAGSPLVDKIEASPRLGSRMPQGLTPLSTQQISTVRAWIGAGALNN